MLMALRDGLVEFLGGSALMWEVVLAIVIAQVFIQVTFQTAKLAIWVYFDLPTPWWLDPDRR